LCVRLRREAVAVVGRGDAAGGAAGAAVAASRFIEPPRRCYGRTVFIKLRRQLGFYILCGYIVYVTGSAIGLPRPR